MNFIEELMPYLPAFLAGSGIGAFNQLGLRYTVLRISAVENPAGVFAVSMAVRYGVIALVFYLLIMRGWEELLAAFIGVVFVKTVLAVALKPVSVADVGEKGGR